MLFSRRIDVNSLYWAVVIYLYLPLFIFVLGWIKTLVAFPLVAVTTVAVFFSMHNICKEKNKMTDSSVKELFVIFTCFFLFFVIAGHSDLFAQDYDWHKHHAIFNDLKNYSWPVVYENNSMLTYYLGQYIVPSFLGKLFQSDFVMRWSIPVWNAIGLSIVYALVCHILRVQAHSKRILVFFLLLLWGGVTSLGSIVFSAIHMDTIEIIPASFKWIYPSIKVHFASNYDALHDAFQHVIAPWLSVCFFLENKKNFESYIMIALPLLFTASFGFVYFAVILLVYALWNLKDTNFSKWSKSVFGFGNLLMLPLAATLFIYFYNYLTGEKPDSVGFRITNFHNYIHFYFIFIFVEFFVYSLLLFKENKKNPLFYIINAELLVIPFLSLGMYNDLCSRGSIPARFILMIMCLEMFGSYSKRNKNRRIVILSMLLSFSIIITGIQFYRHMQSTAKGWSEKTFLSDDFKTLEGFAANPNIREDEAYNYYTLDYTDSWFYIIARRPCDTIPKGTLFNLN